MENAIDLSDIALLRPRGVWITFRTNVISLPLSWPIAERRITGIKNEPSQVNQNVNLKGFSRVLTQRKMFLQQAKVTVDTQDSEKPPVYRITFFWSKRDSGRRVNLAKTPGAEQLMNRLCELCFHNLEIYRNDQDVGFYCKSSRHTS